MKKKCWGYLSISMTITVTQLIFAMYVALLLHVLTLAVLTQNGQRDVMTGLRSLLGGNSGNNRYLETYTGYGGPRDRREWEESVPEYARHGDIEQYERYRNTRKNQEQQKPMYQVEAEDRRVGGSVSDRDDWQRFQQEDFYGQAMSFQPNNYSGRLTPVAEQSPRNPDPSFTPSPPRDPGFVDTTGGASFGCSLDEGFSSMSAGLHGLNEGSHLPHPMPSDTITDKPVSSPPPHAAEFNFGF